MSLGNRCITGLMVALTVGVAASMARAALIETIAGNVEPTPVFGAPGTYGPAAEWHIEQAPFSGGIVSAFGGDPTWTINIFGQAPSSFTWMHSTLFDDTSVGGRASAEFNAGGTMRFEGEVVDDFFNVMATGVLLEGTLSDFSVQEPDTPDFIDGDRFATFTPTGGALFDGGLGLQAASAYIVSFTAALASQDGDSLTNFQGNIEMVEGYKIVLIAVPEPGSLVLLGLGVLAFARRR